MRSTGVSLIVEMGELADDSFYFMAKESKEYACRDLIPGHERFVNGYLKQKFLILIDIRLANGQEFIACFQSGKGGNRANYVREGP